MGQAVLKLKTQDGLNLDEVLDGAKKKEKKKTKVEEVKNIPEQIQEKIDKIREMKRELDSLKAMLNSHFAEVLEVGEKARDELMKLNGYMNSVKMFGKSGESITISWRDQYSKIPLEHWDEIIEIFGQKTEDYFKKKLNIAVKDELPEEMLVELVNAVGKERFAEFFEVQRWISPTTRFTQEKHLLDGEKEKLHFVQQYKPTLRTK